jgi:hypothetical protein
VLNYGTLKDDDVIKRLLKDYLLIPGWYYIVGLVMGAALICLTPLKEYLKSLISNYCLSFFLSLTVLVCIIIIIICLLKIRKLQKELNQIKFENEDLAGANGLALYKNFAYYNPRVEPSKLYCKPCLEDRTILRVLVDDAPFYDCSSCGKRAIDREMQKRLQDKLDRVNFFGF